MTKGVEMGAMTKREEMGDDDKEGRDGGRW